MGSKNLFRFSVIATCISALSLFILFNTFLALTTQHYCVVYFAVPFTAKTILLPNWMWGLSPFLVCTISTVMAIVLWIIFFVKRVRMRRISSSIPSNS